MFTLLHIYSKENPNIRNLKVQNTKLCYSQEHLDPEENTHQDFFCHFCENLPKQNMIGWLILIGVIRRRLTNYLFPHDFNPSVVSKSIITAFVRKTRLVELVSNPIDLFAVVVSV